MRTHETGFTTVYNPYAYLVHDAGGADIQSDITSLVVDVMGDRDAWFLPIPVYISMGGNGAMHTELLYMYVYDGCMYLLGSSASIDSMDINDAVFGNDGGTVLGGMYAKDNTNVYSLGFIGDDVDVMQFAMERVRKQPLLSTPEFDQEQCSAYMASCVVMGNVERSGVVHRPGGTRLEVYAVTSAVSRALRVNKDFSDNPLEESGVPDGMREVILVGGNPDIVPIGGLCSLDGSVWDVWTPNDGELFVRAVSHYESGHLPHDLFSFDVDDLCEAHGMYAARLGLVDEENARREMSESDDDVPEIPMVDVADE